MIALSCTDNGVPIGHRGVASWSSIGSEMPRVSFSIAVQATMRPLSVQRAGGGQTRAIGG